MTIERTLAGAAVAFTTRAGGVSEGPYASLNLGLLTGDEPERVHENRARAAAAAGTRPELVAMGRQVHGNEVLEWQGPPAPAQRSYAQPGAPPPQADGHVTGAAGVTLLVLVADCLPVALAAPGRVGMLHCGWRGLAAGMVAEGVRRLAEGGRGGPVQALVGPGIGRCCYEVGPEVARAFDGVAGALAGRMLDLRAVAAAQLEAAGATVEHVDICTSCDSGRFFSHRRDGGVTGRQAGLIRRTA